MNLNESLNEEYNVITNRMKNPVEGSYTSYLFGKGIDKILKKIGEEATEVIIAAKDSNNSETVCEICDLIFHLEVLMAQMGLSWNDIAAEISKRREKEKMNIEKEAKRKAENRTDETKLN